MTMKIQPNIIMSLCDFIIAILRCSCEIYRIREKSRLMSRTLFHQHTPYTFACPNTHTVQIGILRAIFKLTQIRMAQRMIICLFDR